MGGKRRSSGGRLRVKRPRVRGELHVVLSDLHIPYHDRGAVRLVLEWIKEAQPATIHLLGDIIDFYELSSHQRDPARTQDLQADLNETVKFLAQLKLACRTAKIIYSEGNHEDRFKRYLWAKAGELAHLDSLSLPRLLHLDRLGIPYRTEGGSYCVGDIRMTHGTIIRQHSAYTARAMMLKVGGSVMVGHTHRLGSHFVSTWNSAAQSHENGCLCRLTPCVANAFTKGPPNWQLGFSAIWVHGKQTQVIQVPISNGSLIDPFTGRRLVVK